jgi:hypothetical protein
MPSIDRTLTRLIRVIAALNVLHLVDHVLRGDVHWPVDGLSIGFIVVAAVLVGGIGLGLRFYRSGKVGPLFWTVVGTIGLLFGWMAHFSPSTDQPVSLIYHAYATPFGGTLAVGVLLALMLAVLLASVYSAYLWIGRPKS